MVQMIWLGLIVAGLLALLLGGVLLVGRIAGYYQARFNLSIWPGMVFLIPAFACAGIAGTAVAGGQELPFTVVIGLVAAAVALLVLTGALDIRKAGLAWGLVVLVVQSALAVCFVLVVVALVFKGLAQKLLLRKKE